MDNNAELPGNEKLDDKAASSDDPNVGVGKAHKPIEPQSQDIETRIRLREYDVKEVDVWLQIRSQKIREKLVLWMMVLYPASMLFSFIIYVVTKSIQLVEMIGVGTLALTLGIIVRFYFSKKEK